MARTHIGGLQPEIAAIVLSIGMLTPFVLFLILVIWALIQGDMYAKEAIIYGSIWLVCLLALFLIPYYGFWFVAPMSLVDIILLIKLVGNPRAY